MKNSHWLINSFFLLIIFVGISSSISGQNPIAYQYDKLSRLVKVINPNNNIVEYQYDELGNRTLKSGTLSKILLIQVLPEGLFNPQSTLLNKAQNETGDAFPDDIADSISIELHSSSYPYDRIGSPYRAALKTDGNATIFLSISLNSEYYIVIKHRNSIETWSANPISISSSITSYNFTISSSQAYGSNQKDINGKYYIYAGDVNQDGSVDTADMTFVDNDNSNYAIGYLITDVNGDGIVDTGDLNRIDNNASVYVVAAAP